MYIYTYNPEPKLEAGAADHTSMQPSANEMAISALQTEGPKSINT